MEAITLILFAIALFVCVIFDKSMIYALIFGFVLFYAYSRYKKNSARKTLILMLSGLNSVKNVLITFFFIGLISAIWRLSGTIPSIIYYFVRVLHPSIIPLMAFVLNAAVSFILGTAFGTAATMGAVSMTLGVSVGIDPLVLGGAIFSGIYFGDRCSPVSSVTLLVSDITKTDIYTNIKKMLINGLIPFLLTALIFYFMGIKYSGAFDSTEIIDILSHNFDISPWCLIPAIVILVLSLFKVKSRITMICSIISAVIIAIVFQKAEITKILYDFVFGFEVNDEWLSSVMNGGGLKSMLRSALIVAISSTYIGVFFSTGLLDGIKKVMRKIGNRTSKFVAFLVCSAVTSAVACNQTFSVLLTKQICEGIEEDREEYAFYIYSTAVLLAPFVPYSTAFSIPADSVGATYGSMAFAFFPIFVIIYVLFYSIIKRRRKQ